MIPQPRHCGVHPLMTNARGNRVSCLATVRVVLVRACCVRSVFASRTQIASVSHCISSPLAP